MTDHDPDTTPRADETPAEDDDVRRLDRQLAVANDVAGDDSRRDDEPGLDPSP